MKCEYIYRIALLPIAAAALATMSCSQQSGNASPQHTTESTRTSKQPSRTTSEDSLANFDPCVFTQSERNEYGLTKTQSSPSLPDASCSWQAGDALVNIAKFNRSVEDIKASDEPPEPVTINESEAVRWTYGGGLSCIITFDYGTKQVGVSVDYNQDTERACKIAKQFAEIVEPKLPPRGN